MTVALAVIVGLLVLALVLRERDHDATTTALHVAQQVERDTWAHERGELLTRIQRPDLIPRPHGPIRAQSPAEDRKPPPELHMVGNVAPPRAAAEDGDDEAQEG